MGQVECTGLPELRAGSHVAPEDGACLMEYVSVLAGTPFTDHPRGTDPTLALLARLVNDASSDAGRPLLSAFAPELAGRGPVGPRGTASLVLATASWTCAATGGQAAPVRAVGRAQRRYDRVTGTGAPAAVARSLDVVHRSGSARRRLESCVDALRALPEARRDPALRGALATAIAAVADPVRQAPEAPLPTAARGAPDIVPG